MNEILTFLENQNKLNRTWTKEETSNYRKMNNQYLIELNKTLRPSFGVKTSKVGIFCQGQIGDTAQAMGVLKYADILWQNKGIVWFINSPNADLLRYSNVSEVRPWPWAGFGLGLGEPDHFPYLCNPDNTLNLELAKTRSDTADIECGYFPATHQVSEEKRKGVEYSNVSKRVFGISMASEWHPLLSFSDEEKEMAKKFISDLPNEKTIILETFCGSGQSQLNHDTVINTIEKCKNIWGSSCNFIFVSHKYLNKQYDFPKDFFNERIVSAARFTPRQCALLANYCDLFISVSSGITVTSSCWGNKKFPILQYCGAAVCGTREIANGEIIQVFSDGRPLIDSQNDYLQKLEEILLKYKIQTI